ncbi:hypothetical protein Selin_1437 [Desulfurispirillum indicum S5]|uniref:Uncharacterized protein n=1 Tax=Desulfurispirillum indicum (strain ATCC BAA-1389 / DSM 22839 / S5) TaxID=653733 RepID=E6W6S8_DESIS|nr:hypothetical protein [Desulfurispirillum indicum]ADU66171.1 hypothetical protein Selin_1437 [Desulfurispirillum indicum S5]
MTTSNDNKKQARQQTQEQQRQRRDETRARKLESAAKPNSAVIEQNTSETFYLRRQMSSFDFFMRRFKDRTGISIPFAEAERIRQEAINPLLDAFFETNKRLAKELAMEFKGTKFKIAGEQEEAPEKEKTTKT